MKYNFGFINKSSSTQDWALFLDKVSVVEFSLKPGADTKWVKVDMNDKDELSITVGTSTNHTAEAKVTDDNGKLKLTSKTPNEWVLDQETKDQYVITCKLS